MQQKVSDARCQGSQDLFSMEVQHGQTFDSEHKEN